MLVKTLNCFSQIFRQRSFNLSVEGILRLKVYEKLKIINFYQVRKNKNKLIHIE